MAVGDYKDQGLKTLIPDPKKAADDWYQKHKLMQLNHILVVKESVAKEHPETVREIYRMFVEGKKLGVPPAARRARRPPDRLRGRSSPISNSRRNTRGSSAPFRANSNSTTCSTRRRAVSAPRGRPGLRPVSRFRTPIPEHLR